jgi:hypothetical protein
VTASATQTDLAPGQKTDIVVKLDTRRFAGRKVATVFVVFDQPEAAEVGLRVQADSQENVPKQKPADSNQRLQDLEEKIKELQKEVDSLRKKIRPKEGARLRLKPGTEERLVMGNRSFNIAFQLDEDARSQVKLLLLLCSMDLGRTWQVAARATPNQMSFAFRAPKDGIYWFALKAVDAAGKNWPPDLSSGINPALKVRVDTQK